MPEVEIDYVSRITTGLFEQSADSYGEIWYEFDGRREVSRITTPEGVLDSIFTVTGASAPAQAADSDYRGYPLAAEPRGAAAVFYLAWPLVITGTAFYFQRRRS